MAEELISISPKLQGGAPCIKGTRVSVSSIKAIGLPAEGIQKYYYPHLTIEQIEVALVYQPEQTN
jgi:uncharacterized protein (DUF433 family)